MTEPTSPGTCAECGFKGQTLPLNGAWLCGCCFLVVLARDGDGLHAAPVFDPDHYDKQGKPIAQKEPAG